VARKVEVQIVGDASSLERAFGRAEKAGGKLERGLHKIGKASAVAIGVGAGAGLLGLGVAVHASVKELEQAQKATAQTEAVIKSTGGAANVSAKQVDQLSNSLLKKTGIDDEVIQSGENMLLTFRNVRNETGKNNDIFTQATKIGLDMSTAMEGAGFEGGNLKTTMIRLGKALNDPVTGMTALRRVGVTFTEDQKKTIKRLEETGHHLQAQKIILRELRAEFGGSAEAYGKTLPGQLTIFRERLRNVGAFIVGKFIPIFTQGTDEILKFGDFVSKVAHAPNLKVGLSLAGGGVKKLAAEVKSSLQMALFGGMQIDAMSSQGVVRSFHDGLIQRVMAQDWSPVGKAIGAGIVITTDALNRMLGGILTWTQQHAAQIAEVGIVIAGNIVMKLTDPVFWAHHLGLLVGVLSVAFGSALGKGAARLGAVVAERFGGPVMYGLMTVVSKLPGRMGDAIAVGGVALAKGFGLLFKTVSAPVGEGAGRLTTALVRGLRLTVIITAFRAAFDGVRAAWNAFTDWITLKSILVVRKIVEPFSHLPGSLGGWARDAKDRLNRQLDGIHAEQFARRMEGAASRVQDTAPKIAQAAGAAAALARALKSVPSDTTVRFIVKTLQFTPGNSPRGGAFQGGGHAAGGRIPGARVAADSVPAMLSPGEFVVTGGGERILETMTFPGVLNWLQGVQPRHFAGGGRVDSTKTIEFDRLYPLPAVGGAVNLHGLVPQVIRALSFARGHGWSGTVTSGFRTYGEQAALYQRSPAGGPLAAKPGTSSHEFGQAVDVTNPGGFGATMTSAPPGARLYNRLGAADPVHYSVSGYQLGGRIPGRVTVPRLGQAGLPVVGPAPPPSPLASLRRRIAALRREEARVKRQVVSLQRRLRGMPNKTKAQKHARASVQKQLDAATAHLKRIQAELQSLGQRVQDVLSHDYSTLPAGIEYEIAAAALTDTPADDIRALLKAESYLQNQLRRPGLTTAQKTQILQGIAGVRGQLSGLTGGAGGAGGGGDTGGGPDNTADLQAQLEQANQRANVSAESARLANAFVATGVFSSQTPGVRGSGAPIVVQSLFPPPASWLQDAAAAVAQGAGMQSYVPTSVEKTGF